MFYSLTETIHRIGATQRFHFEHHENAYAFQSRRLREILKAHPAWAVAEDREVRDFDHGTYYRSVVLADADGDRAATLLLEGQYFMDGLVEDFRQWYDDADFPTPARDDEPINE